MEVHGSELAAVAIVLRNLSNSDEITACQNRSDCYNDVKSQFISMSSLLHSLKPRLKHIILYSSVR